MNADKTRSSLIGAHPCSSVDQDYSCEVWSPFNSSGRRAPRKQAVILPNVQVPLQLAGPFFRFPPRALLLFVFGDESAEPGDEGFNARFQALVSGAGLLGELLNARLQVAVRLAELYQFAADFAEFEADFVDLALGVAPEGFVFFAVFVAFFRDSGGEVLDAFEAFFDGHRLWHSLSSLSHLCRS